MPITQRLKKLIKSLHQKQFRDETGLFLSEGEKLAFEVASTDFGIELVVIRESPTAEIQELVTKFSDKGIPIYSAPKHLFDQLTDTKTPQSILTVLSIPELPKITQDSFIALDGISDPGNVGTIIRTADWFGIKQILFSPNCADIFNPKVVRASMGSIFRVNLFPEIELHQYIKKNLKTHKLFAADIKSKNSLEKIKIPKKFGLVFGSESHGISKELSSIVDNDFIISGYGKAESLNVAVSVGISLYFFSSKN